MKASLFGGTGDEWIMRFERLADALEDKARKYQDLSPTSGMADVRKDLFDLGNKLWELAMTIDLIVETIAGICAFHGTLPQGVAHRIRRAELERQKNAEGFDVSRTSSGASS